MTIQERAVARARARRQAELAPLRTEAAEAIERLGWRRAHVPSSSPFLGCTLPALVAPGCPRSANARVLPARRTGPRRERAQTAQVPVTASH